MYEVFISRNVHLIPLAWTLSQITETTEQKITGEGRLYCTHIGLELGISEHGKILVNYGL